MNFDVVEVVIDKTIRTFNLREWQYDIEVCAEDIAEAIKLIGAAKLYEDKVKAIVINSKVGRLPLDCEHIKSLIPASKYYQESGSFIQVDVPDGTQVMLSYQALPTDSRGYPLVPDNAAIREAIMWYLIKILILRGEMKRISFQQAESEWQWRCGSARAELNVLNLHQANRVYNDFVRLNPLKDVHEKDYTELGKPNTTDRTKN